MIKSICGKQMLNWEKCLRENPAKRESCDWLKQPVYNCYNKFWSLVLNEEASALMSHFQKSYSACTQELSKYAECRVTKEKRECKELFQSAELCIASHLDQKIWNKFVECSKQEKDLSQYNENPSIQTCRQYQLQLANMKHFWAKQTLLKMHFTEEEIKEEGVLELLEKTNKQIHAHFFPN